MSHKYQLEQGKRQFIFQTNIVGTSIMLSIENPDKKILTRELTVLGLSALDKIFASVQNAEEGLELIDKVLKEHKVKVKEENQNIKIIMYIMADDIINQIEIPFGDENAGLTKLTEQEILRNVRRSSRIDANINLNINTEKTETEQIPIETKEETNLTENTNLNVNANENIQTNYENTDINIHNTDINQQSTENVETNFENIINQQTTEKIETNLQNIINQQSTEQIETNLENNEALASNNIDIGNNDINIPQTTTTTNENINFVNILPEKILPPKILEANEATNYIPPSETQEYTATNTVIQNNIQTSELPAENYFNNTLENNLVNNIEMTTQTKTEEIAPFSVPQSKDEISSLIVELNKLKNREIENLKIQIDEMMRMRTSNQLNNLDELKKKEEENYLLKKQLEESLKYNKQYESEIKLLRSTQKSNSGLESKNITFEEQAQQVCVKGDIIHSTQELELITRRINTKLNIKNSKLTLNLLYKATADSDQASAFHEKCDKANRTIVLIETDKNKRFGGFTSKSWKGDRIEKNDEEAFIFSLDKMKTYDNIKGELAIGCYPKFGPIFMGCQIRIYDNAFTKGGTTFEKGLNYNTEEDYELNGGERNFIVKEIEVYEVIPQ